MDLFKSNSLRPTILILHSLSRIVSETISSTCRTSRYPIITILLSEVVLRKSFIIYCAIFSLTLLAVTCLARYTAIMIFLSTTIGGVVLSTAGLKLLFPFVCDCLSRLENYFSQHTGSLQALLEDIKMLLPIWIEEEWCEVTPGHKDDDPKTSSGARLALLLPPPLAKEKSTSLPRVLPRVTYEIQPQAQKPDFDPEGWLLV